MGRWLIGMAVGLIGRGMERGKKIDVTRIQYLKSIISVGLTLILVLAILDIFGIKTTSFAALLAGAGLAWPLAPPGAACSATLPPASSRRCCGPTKWAISSTPAARWAR
ncbi:hypothetical protein [Hydrogenophaga sp.]|uniref:hypothetical protein n=1 Tax=Hydrogenophaga sp. TaxID=1904254 RepID=UPI00351D4F54